MSRLGLQVPLQLSPYRSLGLVLIALVHAIIGWGCSSVPHPAQSWSDEFLATTRQADAGELSEAYAGYERLTSTAPSLERARQAEFELARLAQRQGHIVEALARYEALWASPLKDSTGGRALYETARIIMSEKNDVATGLAMHRQVIEEYPDHVASEFSLQELRRHYHRRDAHLDLLDLLEAIHPAVEGTTVGHQMLLLIGEHYEEHRKDEARALEVYFTLHQSCPRCAVGDDGLWRMILIHERHQRWDAALPLLEHLARRTETSWFVGSYNSPRASDARFKLAMIQLLFLEDYGEARKNFNQFLKEFPHSFDADDAAWHIVQSYRLEGDDGRHRRELTRFRSEYPESRFARHDEGGRR